MLRETREALDRAAVPPPDLAAVERALVAEGFALSAPARALLAAWGGRHVRLPHPRAARVEIDFHLDAARAASGIYREAVTDLALRAGTPLCPVGHALGGTLLVGENGAVFAALDDWLVRLGRSADEALDALCSGDSGEPV